MSTELLERAIAAEGGVVQRVAERIGRSRTAISLLRSGKYGADGSKIYELLEQYYGAEEHIRCEALEDEIHPAVCRKYAAAVRDGVSIGGYHFSIVKHACGSCGRGGGR